MLKLVTGLTERGDEMEQAVKKQYYTVDEWLEWDENVRSELYEGDLIMLGQPNQRHQEILGELYGQLWQYLKGKPCKVFPTPFGVKLFETEETAFEPDIVAVCDESKLDGKICNGAPDMVIEILSPSTARMDRKYKYLKYQQAGVKEYWIVDPVDNYVQAGVLSNGSYITSIYTEEEAAVPISVIEGCKINLVDVFGEE